MSRSIKKGPFCDEHLMKKVQEQQDNDKKTSNQNMVPSFNNLS